MNTTMRAAVLESARTIKVQPRSTPELKPGMVLLRVRRAGICGSDLHYFDHGCCGAFVPTRPFVLGHEFAAEVTAIGEGVTNVQVGARVTANPARACLVCEHCKSGRGNLCRQTIMLGSASTTPPTDGAFAEIVTVRANQCHVLPLDMDDATAAMLEPFAVALHAVKRAGVVSGKRVLVTGGGPIGLLVAMTARMFGAAPVALSDVLESRRETALKLGADASLNPMYPRLAEVVREITGDGFDVVFEASGARAALRQAFDLVRPGGTIVQIGTLGTEDIPLPANQLMVREINFIGSMRYGNVFDEAIRLVQAGRIDLRPLISGVLPLTEAVEAMRLAGDKTNTLKVQLEIS
ncbi:MAG: NAD(P)-dependent alcohol dehydrogenase [Verrucomicrobia bacterium]|jgi:L-idonate 5-dehydrogenase|nr:NAD(P)-dependent alcohol dehydrogenase [Verrucomicrobiota bacterium]